MLEQTRVTDSRPTHGLPRDARLGGHDVVGRLFREGYRLRHGEIQVRFYRRTYAGGVHARAAFAVRRGGWARPRRNRLRRLMREAFRQLRSGVEADLARRSLGVDIVFLWSGSDVDALRPSYHRIARCMEAVVDALLNRLGNDSHASMEPQ